VKKITVISRQVSPDLLPGISAGICQTALVDESRMIRNEVETHNRPENGHSAWDAVYNSLPPCDSKLVVYTGHP
jgi:hypothetical protein